MRVALAQINSHLGNFEANAEKILNFIGRAKARRCDLVVFPEAALFGYHPMDLLERPSVVKEQMAVLKRLSTEIPAGIGVLLGAFTPNPSRKGKPFFNSAVLLVKGHQPKYFHKELLPTYDVFDDGRHIEPGRLDENVFRFKGKKILVSICEDIWAWPLNKNTRETIYQNNPVRRLKPGSVDLCVNLSASPYFENKLLRRRVVVKETAKYLKAPVIYVNMVGAQDELIFDGGSFAIRPDGKVLAQSVQWDEDLNVVDFDLNEGGTREVLPGHGENLRRALVLGIRDFVNKTGQKRVHLGLSGGIDSAVVVCLAVDALGADKVTAVAMPGPFSSPQSLKLAEKLAQNLGIKLHQIPIQAAYDQMIKSFEAALGKEKFGIVHENIQARIRGLYLMALANKEGSLLLNTTNKSEMAAGYGTLYGDLCGALSPIGDLLKKDVYQLAELYNAEHELIPNMIIKRPPSAELRPNQKDSDSLPPYELLDASVVRLVEKRTEPKNASDKFLIQALMRSEFKRWQAAPILKVREHSFGQGRRMPLAHRART